MPSTMNEVIRNAAAEREDLNNSPRPSDFHRKSICAGGDSLVFRLQRCNYLVRPMIIRWLQSPYIGLVYQMRSLFLRRP
jgi:hypothetical protein